MLEALFGRDTGHPVLAVGDPRQSIYGWRGASAGTIERFARTFPGLARTAGRAAHAGHQLAQRRAPSSPSPTPCRRCCPPPEQPLPDLAPAPTAGRGRGHRRPLRDRRRGDRGAGRPARRLLARRGPGRAVAATAGRRWRCSSGPASSCPGIAAALRERGRAGGGRRARRAARGARGLRRRRDPHRAGRPDRRRRAGPAAHRCALADRAARPRRPGGPRPGARALAPSGPADGDDRTRAVVEAPAERGSIVEALDDLGGPDAVLGGRVPAAAPAGRASWATCATG